MENYLYVLDKNLHIADMEIEMFSISSKDNVIKVIENNERLIEFNNYIIKMKDNLILLLESDIQEAVRVIDELRSINEYKYINDLEFFSITSTIYFMNMNYDKALEEINSGFYIDDKNFDLIYNKACILEAVGDNIGAIFNYKLAKELCTQNEVLYMINEKIIELTNKNII